MGRNPKFSKEEKIKVCEAYKAGQGSYKSLAKSIGAAYITVKKWCSLYRYHGASAFEYSNSNASYTKEFKLEIIEAFISGTHSRLELSGKYNVSLSVVERWIKMYNEGIEIKDYDPKGAIYTMDSRKTTFKERLEIVEWVIDNDMDYKKAAKQNGIKYALVYKWVQKYLKDGAQALRYKKRGPKSKNTVDENNLSDVEKLKLEFEREKALRKHAEFKLEVLKKKKNSRKSFAFENKARSRLSYGRLL